MARHCNGTSSDYLNSASTIDLSGQSKIVLACWFYDDSFSNDGAHLASLGASGSGIQGGFSLRPHSNSTGTWEVVTQNAAYSPFQSRHFVRPSSAAWHHYVINIDRSLGSHEITEVYLDGVSVTLTDRNDGDTTGNFANDTLWLMQSGDPSAFLAGSLAEWAIWGGIKALQADVNTLYGNGPQGEASTAALATSVQSGSLHNYWRILGNASPEPNTVGGIDLTVAGTTQVAHPIALSPGGSVPSFGVQELGWMAATTAWR